MRRMALPGTSRTPADGTNSLHVGWGSLPAKPDQMHSTWGPRPANHHLNNLSEARPPALIQREQRPVLRSPIGDVGSLNSEIVDFCLALQVLQVELYAVLVGYTGAKNQLASTGHGALQGEFVHLIKVSNP